MLVAQDGGTMLFEVLKALEAAPTGVPSIV
jgi:hypothetical protein